MYASPEGDGVSSLTTSLDVIVSYQVLHDYVRNCGS